MNELWWIWTLTLHKGRSRKNGNIAFKIGWTKKKILVAKKVYMTSKQGPPEAHMNQNDRQNHSNMHKITIHVNSPAFLKHAYILNTEKWNCEKSEAKIWCSISLTGHMHFLLDEISQTSCILACMMRSVLSMSYIVIHNFVAY